MCANIPAGGALHWLESNIQPDLIILRLCKFHLINSALFKKNLFMQVMSSHSLLSSFSGSFLAVTMKVRTDRKAHQKDPCSSQFFLIYRVRPACYGHSALPGCTWVCRSSVMLQRGFHRNYMMRLQSGCTFVVI